MALDFIDYQVASQENREMITNHLWEIKLTPPAGVYAPPHEIFNTRVQNVDLGITMDIDSIDTQFRGFNISQPTTVITSGALSFTLTDMEDMSMQWMFEEWANKICTRDKRIQHKKKDVVTNVQFLQYNTTRHLIKQFIFYNCFPIINPQHEQNGFDASNAQNVGMLNWTLKYEHYQRKIESAPDAERISVPK